MKLLKKWFLITFCTFGAAALFLSVSWLILSERAAQVLPEIQAALFIVIGICAAIATIVENRCGKDSFIGKAYSWVIIIVTPTVMSLYVRFVTGKPFDLGATAFAATAGVAAGAAAKLILHIAGRRQEKRLNERLQKYKDE